jgi:hypothetical protein
MRRTIACFALLLALPAPAQAQSDAQGDSYLNAFRLNGGTDAKPEPLPAAGASFTADTTAFGHQPDIFNPPRTGGSAEPNSCADPMGRPTPYGRTAWGWVHTRRWTQADIKAAGAFDSVLAVMPFTSPTRPRLNVRGGICVSRLTTMEEDFGEDRPILAPGWYAIQVGGVNEAGGQVTVSAVLREPPRVTAQVRASARRRAGAASVDVRVNAPRGAKLEWNCVRGKCRLPRDRVVTRAGLRRYLNDQVVPNAARLELRVTQAGHIGSYFAWNVRNGRLGRVLSRCTEPASTRPRTRCNG